MQIILRPGISWCICARQAVFLDLPGDRYFCLPEALDQQFQRWSAGEPIGAEAGQALIAADVARPGSGPLPEPATHAAAKHDLAIGMRSRSIGDILAATLGQLRARRRLKRRPLVRIVTEESARRASRPDKVHDEAVLRRIAAAFVTSAMILRAADQCLPRALATAWICHRHGQQAALIFGVRLHPFAAHSWVQSGDAVIVGDFEQVRLYTPILVLQ